MASKRDNPAETSGGRDNYDNRDSNQYANLLDKYSQSLDKSAEALRASAKGFDSTAKSLSESYKNDTDRLIKALAATVKAFNKSSEEVEETLNKSSESQVKEASKQAQKADEALDKQSKLNEGYVSRQQAVGMALIKSFKIAGDYIVGKLSNAFNNSVSSYEAHFSSVTVRMNQSAGDYTNMLKDQIALLKKDGLNIQFDQSDFLDSLESTLATGMRGDQAQEMAYQNLITNKLVPALSTNSKTYTRMSKVLGDSFTKNITAMEKYSESLYGAEGQEEGTSDAYLEIIAKEMVASGLEQGKSEEEIGQDLAALKVQFNQIAAQYGNDYALQLLEEYKNVVTGSQSASEIGLTAAKGSFRNTSAISAEDLKRFSDDFGGLLEDSPMNVGFAERSMQLDYIIGKSLGPDTVEAIDALKGVDSRQIYEDYADKLAEGYGQSKTAQQEKWFSNTMAPVADTLSQHIPDINGVLKAIRGVATAWFAAWTISKGKEVLSGGSGGGKISNFLGKSVGSKGVTMGGALAGGAMLVAGAAMTGYDIYKGVSQSQKDGDDGWTAAGKGALSAVTGHVGMTKDEEKSAWDAALRGEKQSIDLKEVGWNAGKMALIGGGAGTLAGGPVGTAVGALVGAVTGGVTNLITQAAENAKFNKLAETVQEYNDVVQKSTEAQQNYQEVLSKSQSTEKILEDLKSGTIKSEEDRNAVLLQLQQQYPTILGDISDESELTQEKIELLENQIRLEKKQAIIEMNNSNDGLGANTQKLLKEAANTKISKVDQEFMKNFTNEEDLEGDWTAKLTETATKAGYSNVADYVSHLNSTSNHGDLFVLKDGKYVAAGSSGSDYMTSGDNFEQWHSDHGNDDIGANVTAMQAQFDKTIRDMNQYYTPLLEAYSQFGVEGEDGKTTVDLSGWGESEKSTLYDNFGGFTSMYTSAYNIAKGYDLHGYVEGRARATYPQAGEVFEAFGQKKPEFLKLGRNKVPYDDYPAVLHQDEMVLTAANASILRSLSEGQGGISGFLRNLMSPLSSRAVASNGSTTVESPIVSAITSQTEVLVDKFSVVIDLLSQLVPSSTVSADTSVSVNQKMISYEGV